MADNWAILLLTSEKYPSTLLTSARMISFQEAMDLISRVKLGIGMGMNFNVGIETLNELMIITQPAHLQEAMGEKLMAEQRDIVRAGLIRKKLA